MLVAGVGRLQEVVAEQGVRLYEVLLQEEWVRREEKEFLIEEEV